MGSFEEYGMYDEAIRTGVPVVLRRHEDKYSKDMLYSEELVLSLLGVREDAENINRTSVSSAIVKLVTKKVRGMQRISADGLRAIVVSCMANVNIEDKV